MFERIVVGVDGSEGSAFAIDEAAELAQGALATGAPKVEMHFVFAHHPLMGWEVGAYGESLAAGQIDLGAMEKLAEEQLDAARARLDDFDLPGEGLVVHRHAIIGTAFDAIVNTAEDVDADLIVVGSRGHGAGKRLLLGSVSTKVVHHATCSVLVVHGEIS
jgi:nucleotide-binding universal stress UspA family protein